MTHTLRRVSDPLDLLGAFKAKEYSATAYYSGPFRIADTMTIKVKVAGACSLVTCLQANIRHLLGGSWTHFLLSNAGGLCRHT